MASVSRMLQLESMLRWHGAYTAPVAWEMDRPNAESLARGLGGPGIDLDDIDAGSLQCLGVPVTIVERPGIRLVFTVTESADGAETLRLPTVPARAVALIGSHTRTRWTRQFSDSDSYWQDESGVRRTLKYGEMLHLEDGAVTVEYAS